LQVPGPDRVLGRLRSFEPIRFPPLRWLASSLPYLAILLFLGGVLFQVDLMFLSGMLAASLAAFLFVYLLKQIPRLLADLWKRHVLAVPDRTAKLDPSDRSSFAAALDRLPSWLGSLSSSQRRHLSGDLEQRYLDFINRFQSALNSRFAWLFGVGTAAIMYVSFPIRFYPLSHAWWNHLTDWLAAFLRQGSWLPIVEVALQLVLAFGLGLLLWRMAVTAHKIYQLGGVFDFKLQVSHPDHCGGFRPVGDVCLTNALILTMPATFLAIWLTANRPEFSYYTSYYHDLLWIVFVLALVAFVQPVYGVHLAMQRDRLRLQKSVDDVDQRIADLTSELLAEAGSADANRLDELRRQLSALREIYEANSVIPTWPFDRRVVSRFSLAQFIPLLGLTGIGPSVVSTLERVFPTH
jgi:hypothetical protein